jgi:HSP20 family protein
MNVHENPEGNTVTASFELPGLGRDDVQVNIHNNILTVSGEFKTAADKEEKGYVVRERRFGKFSRSLQLPRGVYEKDIELDVRTDLFTCGLVC